MWVGFNSRVYNDDRPQQLICYLTPINASPTSASIVLETMEQSKKVAEDLHQSCIQHDNTTTLTDMIKEVKRLQNCEISLFHIENEDRKELMNNYNIFMQRCLSGEHDSSNGPKTRLPNGYVNKQNCRIWSEANSQVYVKTPLHPETLTVWCALCAGGIIGPYFFKNDEGHNVAVYGDRYKAMITSFFISELNNHDVQELWFQQDGATCHTARATIDLLKDTFGDRLISRFGSVNWPPRSCDLKPLDYFLWGYV
ncbi:uncharacterized protein TNCV_4277621 [Trichonephila clavipes]|nr:uncharacterized protein TNCV_4277621 [Trichonephila clavipes]